MLLLVAGAVVAWNGWQFYQRNQAAQAAAEGVGPAARRETTA